MPILQLTGFDEVDDPFGDAKVQRFFDMCKKTPFFFIWWNCLGIRKAKHLVLRLKER